MAFFLFQTFGIYSIRTAISSQKPWLIAYLRHSVKGRETALIEEIPAERSNLLAWFAKRMDNSNEPQGLRIENDLSSFQAATIK